MNNSKYSLLSYELELYKDLYETENKYRNDFSDRTFKTITVIVSIIGALIWLIIKFTSIYKNQCCYLQCVNILLLLICCALSSIIIVIFFKILYNYQDTRINPEKIFNAIEEYKKNNIEENVIFLANQSLAMTYISAAIKNCAENKKRIKMLGVVYKLIIADIFCIIFVFIIEVLL